MPVRGAMTQLKVRMLSVTTSITLIAVLAIATGAYEFLFRHPSTHNGRRDQDLTLFVNFEPRPRVRSERVYIRVTVDGIQVMDELTSSTWVRDVQVAKGKTIVLEATQEHGQDLWCLIKDGNMVIADDRRVGPGDINCTAKGGVNF